MKKEKFKLSKEEREKIMEMEVIGDAENLVLKEKEIIPLKEKKPSKFISRLRNTSKRNLKEMREIIKLVKIHERKKNTNSLENLKEELKKIKSDDLANWYKEHEKYISSLSSMEICNENHNCNKFVIKKLKERIEKVFEKVIGNYSYKSA